MLDIFASIPLLHFFRRVSMLRLETWFFKLPTILLKTTLTTPLLLAYSMFAMLAYPPSSVVSRGTLPYVSITLSRVGPYRVLSAGLPFNTWQSKTRLLLPVARLIL